MATHSRESSSRFTPKKTGANLRRADTPFSSNISMLGNNKNLWIYFDADPHGGPGGRFDRGVSPVVGPGPVHFSDFEVLS
jgi:hypothetical protein